MSGGDFFELLFVIAFILFGILGGRKKKPGAGQPQVPRPRPAPDRSPAGRHPQPPPRAGSEPSQDALLRELEGLLTGRRPLPVEQDEPRWSPASSDRVPDPEEARSLESLEVEETAVWEEGLERASEVRDTARWTEGRDRPAASLETLEEAGEASHERYHERYDFTVQAERAARGPTFDVRDVRRAVIWSEILGPPVSER
jgi:hypothetical protein